MLSCIYALLLAVIGAGTLSLGHHGHDAETTLIGDVRSLPQSGDSCELHGLFTYVSGSVHVTGIFDCAASSPQAGAYVEITGLEQRGVVFGSCDGVESTLFGLRGMNCRFNDSLSGEEWNGSLEYAAWPF